VIDFPPGVDMCRDCGAAHRMTGPCPRDCEHRNREVDELWMRTEWCLDCEQWVAPTGEEDEEGHPTWEIA
jgi:hypothetical protein